MLTLCRLEQSYFCQCSKENSRSQNKCSCWRSLIIISPCRIIACASSLFMMQSRFWIWSELVPLCTDSFVHNHLDLLRNWSFHLASSTPLSQIRRNFFWGINGFLSQEWTSVYSLENHNFFNIVGKTLLEKHKFCVPASFISLLPILLLHCLFYFAICYRLQFCP